MKLQPPGSCIGTAMCELAGSGTEAYRHWNLILYSPTHAMMHLAESTPRRLNLYLCTSLRDR